MNNDNKKELIEKSVKITKRGATVKSDDVAKAFGKQHKTILAMIKREIIHILIDDGIIDKKEFADYKDFTKVPKEKMDNLLAGNPANKKHISKYFIDSSYIDSKGRKYQRYELTRKGFDLIVLGLTGQNARKYKRWYIDEFHKKDKVIRKNKQIAYENKENPIWLEFRKQGKEIRTKFTEAIKEVFIPKREAERKETNIFLTRYIISFTRLIYKKLNIEIPKGTELNRDSMDLRTLFKIEQEEEKIRDLIYKYKDLHYKEIYKKIKKEIL